MRKGNKNLKLKRKLRVPILDCVVWLVVAENLEPERRKMEHWFGPPPPMPTYKALCSYGAGHNFALFFEPAALTTETIAHEIFHVTHRIIDWCGVKFDEDHHEMAALLNGWLNQQITEILL